MVTLSAETQRLIEERMKAAGLSTPDELVRLALQSFKQAQDEPVEDLDPSVVAAIDEGLAQADRGETLAWGDVRDALRGRFADKR